MRPIIDEGVKKISITTKVNIPETILLSLTESAETVGLDMKRASRNE